MRRGAPHPTRPRSRATPGLLALLGALLAPACHRRAATPGGGGGDTASDTAGDGGAAAPLPATIPIPVTVTLDGAPAAGITLAQGGNPARWTTDEAGRATVVADTRVQGEQVLMASHPEARIGAVMLDEAYEQAAQGQAVAALSLALSRYATTDNPAYVFQDPGEPTRADTTDQCAHCHTTITADWYSSAHASAARNPIVHDLYAGAAHAYADQAACEAAGGRWWTGIGPGTGAPAARCYLGVGVQPELDPGCGDTGPCDGVSAVTAECADCHAPGLDGVLGGRDLLEATGLAYDYGVHCDVCHKIADVDPDDPAPGVGGRIKVLRPAEEGSGVFDWQPLMFGPYDDVPNPRMGSVASPLFQQARLCAGCHQLDAPALLPGAALDPARWPDGVLPVQSTWQEWLEGPYGDAEGDDGAPCQSCHMPPDADVGNSADLGNVLVDVEPGVAAGWYREPGAVRRHTWFGPRSAEQRMIDLAAALWLTGEVDGGAVEVSATVQSVGPGHGLPTGEPMRHLVLVVQALCDGAPVEAVGGDVVGDDGGWLDRKEAGEGWARWPGAAVGDRIRVARYTGEWHDYQGHGPFGDGRFAAQDKGLPVLVAVGSAAVVAVDGDVVTLDGALPAGDVAWRVDGAGLPAEGAAPLAWAGAPGFTFARVLVDPEGQRMVPHHRAVDVVADNRLLPGQAWTSTHRFPACETGLAVQAALLYRPYPLWLARQKGWAMVDQVMATATAEVGP